MQRWRIAEAPAAAEIDAVAQLLLGGGIVLLPTDTIYGLHAVATNDAAIGRLANAKGRDEAKPFVVIADSTSQLKDLGIEFPAEVRADLESLWPAPLTAVLPLRHPLAASRGARSLAVRIPAVPWLREIAARTGPLASTSANRSGNPPVSAPEQLADEVLERIDGVVDSGPRAGEPSMILDFTQTPHAVLREGSEAFTQKVWKTLRKTL